MSEREMRNVLVYWRDEPDSSGMFTTVCIDGDWVDGEDDENIFFYFTDEATYRDALLNGTEEFTLEEVL